MIKTDVNSVHLSGVITTAKLWDPRPGKSFTSGSIAINTGDSIIRLNLTVNIDGKFDEVAAFGRRFVVDRPVTLVNGFFTGYERNKDGKKEYVYKVEGRLSSSSPSHSSGINLACVSGTIQQQSGQGIILASHYYSRGTNPELKSRQLKVKLPATQDVSVGSRGLFIGKALTTDKGAYLDCSEYTIFSF